MISPTIQNAINDQIKHEFFSSYLYLSMSAYFETQSLPGFASWMRVQSQEEHAHAMKFFDFLNDRGGSVELQALDQPAGEFQSPTQKARPSSKPWKPMSPISQFPILPTRRGRRGSSMSSAPSRVSPCPARPWSAATATPPRTARSER